MRTFSVSPGPPPPRSPLRIRKNPQSIENLLVQASDRLDSPKPQETGDTATVSAETFEIKAIAYHDLADPAEMTRRGSHSASTTSSDALSPIFHRRWNIKDYKKYNKPLHVVDALVKSLSPKPPRRKLRRARPQEPRPLDLSKIRVQTHIRQESQRAGHRKSDSFHTPAVRQMSHGVASPVEQVSQPKTNYARKPVAIPVKGRKSPAPRPRSAKMPPRGMRGIPTPPRSKSPNKIWGEQREDTPTLPSPPPRRELPPTPKKHTYHLSESVLSTTSAAPPQPSPTKALPALPLSALNTIFPSPPSSARSVVSKSQPWDKPAATHAKKPSLQSSLSRHSHSSGSLEARLEALERHNKLLESALMAVLKTNGTMNGCPHHSDSSTVGSMHGIGHHPAFAGERQSSGSSRLSSSANSSVGAGHGAALDVYMSTRGRRGL